MSYATDFKPKQNAENNFRVFRMGDGAVVSRHRSAEAAVKKVKLGQGIAQPGESIQILIADGYYRRSFAHLR